MRTSPDQSTDDDREAMIRLVDIVGHEHIFAPYHIDTPMPAAPGLLALVRPSGHRMAGIHGLVHPPWWDVLYIEQSKNVCRRAGGLLRALRTNELGQVRVMVHWMRQSSKDEREAAERALIEAHDPALNRANTGAISVQALAAYG